MEQEKVASSGTSLKVPMTNANIFSLKSKKPSSPGGYQITVDFSQSVDNCGKPRIVLPQFIKSKATLWNGFAVPQQQGFSNLQFIEMSQNFINGFQAKVSQNHTELFAPKPKSTFCYVCKMSFSDYLNHINHDVHKLNVNKCSISGEIRKAADQFLSSSSSRRPTISDYENEGIQVGSIKPTKRRANQQTTGSLNVHQVV